MEHNITVGDWVIHKTFGKGKVIKDIEDFCKPDELFVKFDNPLSYVESIHFDKAFRPFQSNYKHIVNISDLVKL